jgi:hypothetical protein
LGGDVHVGTFSVLRSSRRTDEYHPLIYQFTSSPISNKPTKVPKKIRKVAPDISIGKNIPFTGRLIDIFPERNFGIVEVRNEIKISGIL